MKQSKEIKASIFSLTLKQGT